MNAVPKLTGKYLHECSEWDDDLIDETCFEFASCRCYRPTQEFLDAQDSITLKLDLLRGPSGE